MPELPEVETVRRGLEPAMVGARLSRVEQRRADLRFPFPEHFVRRLEGRRIDSLSRRAKRPKPACALSQRYIRPQIEKA